MNSRCLLSVNVNKIATLRNARGGDQPNLIECTKDLIRFGAQGITVHPRPDRRHIKTQDIFELNQLIRKTNDVSATTPKNKGGVVEFNIEGYPNPEHFDLVAEARPHQCTLVPDPPDAITSNAGWELKRNKSFLIECVKQLRKLQIRSSLFVDPFLLDKHELFALEEIRPDRVELYTERYARDFSTDQRDSTTRVYRKAAKNVFALGMGVNAGHDLSLQNTQYLVNNVPEIVEVSVGHALICESLYFGFQKTIEKYLLTLNRTV